MIEHCMYVLPVAGSNNPLPLPSRSHFPGPTIMRETSADPPAATAIGVVRPLVVISSTGPAGPTVPGEPTPGGPAGPCVPRGPRVPSGSTDLGKRPSLASGSSRPAFGVREALIPSTASAFLADSARLTASTALAGVTPDSATARASAESTTAARACLTAESPWVTVAHPVTARRSRSVRRRWDPDRRRLVTGHGSLRQPRLLRDVGHRRDSRSRPRGWGEWPPRS